MKRADAAGVTTLVDRDLHDAACPQLRPLGLAETRSSTAAADVQLRAASTSTTAADVQLRAASTSTTAADLEERVAKLFRRPVVDDRVKFGRVVAPEMCVRTNSLITTVRRRAVVDDGVDARVEVRQTVPEHAHRLAQRSTQCSLTPNAVRYVALRSARCIASCKLTLTYRYGIL